MAGPCFERVEHQCAADHCSVLQSVAVSVCWHMSNRSHNDSSALSAPKYRTVEKARDKRIRIVAYDQTAGYAIRI